MTLFHIKGRTDEGNRERYVAAESIETAVFLFTSHFVGTVMVWAINRMGDVLLPAPLFGRKNG